MNAFAVAPESDWAYGLADKAIWKSDLAGGRPVPFVIEVNTRGKDLAIAVDEASVYWGSASAILSVPRQGGSLVTLATARTPSAIVLDATTVYWLDKGELTTRDDGSCCERPSAVMKVSRSGGAPTTLASGQFYSGTLALEGSSLFWTTQHISLDSTLKVVGTVLSVPTKGGVPITLASTKYDPTSIAVDSSSIYWTELGGVMKMPRTGGAPVTIAEEQNEAVSVAVDTTSVYWTSGASGMVVKVTSK